MLGLTVMSPGREAYYENEVAGGLDDYMAELQPQLHSHVLVANRVRCGDGQWRALDGRELFAVQTAAGYLYRAALRAELTARLGVAWHPVDAKGQADIAGVPTALVDCFSARSRQLRAAAAPAIEAMERDKGRGLSNGERAALLQAAALTTRKAKPQEPLTTGELTARWRTTADDLGHPADTWLPATLNQVRPRSRTTWRVDADGVLAELEAERSTFARADVVKAITRRLPTTLTTTAAEAAAVVDAEADRVLAHSDVVTLEPPATVEVPATMRRRDGLPVQARHGVARHTTRRILEWEDEVVGLAQKTAGPVIDPPLVRQIAASDDLGEDQTAAVVRVCSGGEQVVCLVGPAGAGKTRALRAAVSAFTVSGFPVRGLAVSAAAARVLTDEAGLPADTLAKLLHHGGPLQRGEVVVLDEASMCSTHDLAALARLVQGAQARLVLVGDDRQLGAVEAGGLFRLLCRQTAPAELETIRRFTQPWEADASRLLRHGRPTAITTYEEHDRVSGGLLADVLDRALDSWQQIRENRESVIVVAPDHATVNLLANSARARLVASGHVAADGVPVAHGEQVAGVGDQILTLQNRRDLTTSRHAWVANGDRWTVVARHQDGSLDLDSPTRRGQVTLPADYVCDNVALAYATTIHKAQGVTVDHAVAVITPATSAAALYVAMTRGRHSNQALVVTEPHDDGHHRAEPQTPADALRQILDVDRTEQSATETLRRNLDAADDLAVLVPLHDEISRHLHPPHIGVLYSRFNDTGTRMAWARRDLQQATADVERATAA